MKGGENTFSRWVTIFFVQPFQGGGELTCVYLIFPPKKKGRWIAPWFVCFIVLYLCLSKKYAVSLFGKTSNDSSNWLHGMIFHQPIDFPEMFRGISLTNHHHLGATKTRVLTRSKWSPLGSMGFSGTPKDMGPPYGKLPIPFPYWKLTIRGSHYWGSRVNHPWLLEVNSDLQLGIQGQSLCITKVDCILFIVDSGGKKIEKNDVCKCVIIIIYIYINVLCI